jgi:hypothetical protein
MSENLLFAEFNNPDKNNWIPPDEPFVSKEALKNAKTAEVFITAWDNPKNHLGGPLYKQSMKTSFLRVKGKKHKLLIKLSDKGYEMPVMMTRPPEPSLSGSSQQKRVLKDALKWDKINESYFKKWVIVDKLVFIYPKLQSQDKRTIALIDSGEAVPKLTIPDIDNMEKFLFDIMQNLNHDPNKDTRKNLPIPWLANDGCVFWIKNMYKCYGIRPGTYIKMRGQ